MKKKRTILKYKTFDNLYLSSEIFNVLKKFREKKQVSRYFNLFNSFDLDQTTMIVDNLRFNSFHQNDFVKYENNELREINSNSLYFIKLDHYINSLIAYSFIKNIYYALRNDQTLNDNVKSDLWASIRNDFSISTNTIRHSLNISLIDLYGLSHLNGFRSFQNMILNRARRNSLLKDVYSSTLKAFNQLLNYLKWDIQNSNKIFQCCLSGLFYRFGSVSSFYKDIPISNLENVSAKYRLVFYDSENDLFVSNHLINKNLYFEMVDDVEYEIKPIYLSSKKTIIINKDETTLKEFPSVQLTTNNNRLRAYNYRVIDGLPFAQMPYEKNKDENFYLGVELEVNKSSRSPRNIVKMLEEKILSGTAICKSDGSLGNKGLELNIVPMTLAYAKQTNYWFNFEKNVKDYLYSYRDKKTGVHVHVPRKLLTRYQIGLIGQFLNKLENLQFMNGVCGRDLTTSSYSRVDHSLKATDFRYETERYSALNTIPRNTVEFRIFKGNISASTIYRYLEFVHSLCFCVRSNSLTHKTNLNDFIKYVQNNSSEYPVLDKWIKCNFLKSLKGYKKIESFDVVYKKRFRNISFKVPTLKLSEPLRFRRVRAIRTRANVPSSLSQPTTNNNESR